MTDLETLHEAWGAPEAPSHAAYTRARASLLARADASAAHLGGRASAGRRFRAPRPGARLAVTGACALTLVAGVIAVENLDRTGADGRRTSLVPGLPSVPVAAADVLERAAVAAAKQPFTAPRDDQWIYFEDQFTVTDGAETQRMWRRADGGGIAWIDEQGKLEVQMVPRPKAGPGRPRAALLEGYKALAALPTDPDALLRWAYGLDMTNGNSSKDGVVYLLLNHIVRENVLPPELESAIFRAMKQIPGVTLDSTVDVLGRPAYALGQTDDWLHEELLLDKETYAYRGERSTVVKDATIDPAKAGNATGAVKRGHKVVVARVETKIVDEAGQRR